MFGERKDACGGPFAYIQQQSDVFPFPGHQLPPYAIGAYLDPPGSGPLTPPTPVRCDGLPLKIRNGGTVPAQLVLIYNAPVQFAVPGGGVDKKTEYKVIGWDADADAINNRARFRVATEAS